ncbi:MaoC family dehydratase [Nocardioides sp. IC4_145]|uniref:MaoC family dehydratase n=1 Tax=Nocardioides sp. IC4_145 TaxID=2714037 RepID=UPI00140DC41B|nr:MaoC family dehydratase [Nocardioides sp. IC4_145]NHC21914.1 MaoC family dehydratase [Nocardioides sp. IC4_145]
MATFPAIAVDLEGLESCIGATAGPGPWLAVDQGRIGQFADVTEDHQWIHVDPQRAAAGPFGGTVAHGYLTLSLIPRLIEDLIAVDGVTMGVNYGLNKVRFPASVPAGSRVRASVELMDVTRVSGGAQLQVRVIVESDVQERPVCVAEVVFLYFS